MTTQSSAGILMKTEQLAQVLLALTENSMLSNTKQKGSIRQMILQDLYVDESSHQTAGVFLILNRALVCLSIL